MNLEPSLARPASKRWGAFAQPCDDHAGPSLPLAAGMLRKVDAKEHLFLEGDERRNAFTVKAGAIALYKLQMDGRRQIHRFALPGDIIGVGWELEEDCNAQATVSSLVSASPIAPLRRAAEQSVAVARMIGEMAARDAHDLQQQLACVCQNGAFERVAAFLLRLALRIGAGEGASRTFELPMTRSDIADCLGLTLETVSREMSRLRSRNLIRIERITHITVPDLRRLAAIAFADRAV